MNNRGFTLVELMATITILALVLLISTPLLMDVLDQSKERLSNEQKLAIENSARAWGFKHLHLEKDGATPSVKSVSLKELQDDGDLGDKAVFKNLRVKEKDTNKIGVCISYRSEQFIYEFTDNVNSCG